MRSQAGHVKPENEAGHTQQHAQVQVIEKNEASIVLCPLTTSSNLEKP
jgi:hypothetical protein